MRLEYTVTKGGKLANVLRKELRFSTALINRVKKTDGVSVAGIARHMDYQTNPGDVVVINLPEDEIDFPAEYCDLSILYEDDYLLAVDKPAGMLVHPTRSRNTGTLANYVAGYYQRTGQDSGFHPVSRLDRDTFGVVLIAKNSYVHSLMHSLLLDGAVEKKYHAAVYGSPKQNAGEINAPIARRLLPSLLREINDSGKPAISRYSVIDSREEVSLLELEPVTGRTHQLRLHCMYAEFPIIGDPHYNSPKSAEFSLFCGISGQMLCAKKIAFLHPLTGDSVYIESKFDVSLEN